MLVEQYRPAVRATSLEIPAGKLESGEDPLRCAKRELLEETGYGAGRWTPLLTIYTTPGFTNERIWLYRSENVRKFGVPRPGEIDRLRLLTLREAMDALARGSVADAKTALALQMHAAHHAASSQD